MKRKKQNERFELGLNLSREVVGEYKIGTHNERKLMQKDVFKKKYFS